MSTKLESPQDIFTAYDMKLITLTEARELLGMPTGVTISVEPEAVSDV